MPYTEEKLDLEEFVDEMNFCLVMFQDAVTDVRRRLGDDEDEYPEKATCTFWINKYLDFLESSDGCPFV